MGLNGEIVKEILKQVKDELKRKSGVQMRFPVSETVKEKPVFGLDIVTDGNDIWLEQNRKYLHPDEFPKLYKIRVSMFINLVKRSGLSDIITIKKSKFGVLYGPDGKIITIQRNESPVSNNSRK